MAFKKGHTPWNKGKEMSKETKIKMSKNFKEREPWNKGKRQYSYCEECNKEFRVFKSRKKRFCSRECYLKSGFPKTLGKYGFTRKKLLGNKFRKGIKPWNYIDGRSKLLGPARYGDDWDKIRYLVYLRDKFTCQKCGIKGVRLDIHHKKPFLISFDNSLSNLVTLCRPCHRQEEARIMRELKQIKLEN